MQSKITQPVKLDYLILNSTVKSVYNIFCKIQCMSKKLIVFFAEQI